jgi:hypothetical protein
MNRKAVIIGFYADVVAFLFFAILVAGYLLLFKPTGVTEYKILSSQMPLSPQISLNNYLGSTVKLDIENDGKQEDVLISEMIALCATKQKFCSELGKLDYELMFGIFSDYKLTVYDSSKKQMFVLEKMPGRDLEPEQTVFVFMPVEQDGKVSLLEVDLGVTK